MHRIEGKDMIWLCLSWWIYSPSMSIWMVKWRSTMRFWGRLSSDKAMVLCSQELNHKYHWPLKKSWLSDYLHVTGWLQQGPGFATATRLQLHTTYFNHAFPRRHRSRDGAEGNLGALCGEAVFQRGSWGYDCYFVLEAVSVLMAKSIARSLVDNLKSWWWFVTFFIFPNSWDDDPIWRTPSFFRGVGQPPIRMGAYQRSVQLSFREIGR